MTARGPTYRRHTIIAPTGPHADSMLGTSLNSTAGISMVAPVPQTAGLIALNSVTGGMPGNAPTSATWYK